MVDKFDKESHDSKLADAVYEALTQGWESDLVDERAGILDEAYYSIGCDYFLSYYLQFPNFINRPKNDFLKPYFELYLKGRRIGFDSTKMVIYRG